MEQLQAFAQMYFPGTGSPLQRQHAERHFIGSVAGDEGRDIDGPVEFGDPASPVSGSISEGAHRSRPISETLPEVRDDTAVDTACRN